MNDRFRFRAWNKEEQKMHYDAEETYDTLSGTPPIYAECFSCLLHDSNWEVEQCTGLKDCTGRLVYEGDIIAHEDDPNNPYVVKWDDENGCFVAEASEVDGFAIFADLFKQWKVIGNIHEKEQL